MFRKMKHSINSNKNIVEKIIEKFVGHVVRMVFERIWFYFEITSGYKGIGEILQNEYPED